MNLTTHCHKCGYPLAGGSCDNGCKDPLTPKPLQLCIVCRNPLKDDGTCFRNCNSASRTRSVGVCGVPHEMTIVEGGVMFSDKSGFYGVTGRFMWEYKCHLWYLVCSEDSFGTVAGCHLVRMHKLLTEMIGGDHEQFELKWKDQRC